MPLSAPQLAKLVQWRRELPLVLDDPDALGDLRGLVHLPAGQPDAMVKKMKLNTYTPVVPGRPCGPAGPVRPFLPARCEKLQHRQNEKEYHQQDHGPLWPLAGQGGLELHLRLLRQMVQRHRGDLGNRVSATKTLICDRGLPMGPM